MSFFDDLPVPPERPRQPKFVVPPWAAPPSDERCFNRPSNRYGTQGGGGFRFGVAYADGRKASADEWPHRGIEGADPGPGPVLTTAGGGGGSGSDDEVTSSVKFWLWPLPTAGELRIVAQWADVGMGQESIVVSGDVLASAAELVQPYWLTPG